MLVFHKLLLLKSYSNFSCALKYIMVFHIKEIFTSTIANANGASLPWPLPVPSRPGEQLGLFGAHNCCALSGFFYTRDILYACKGGRENQ